MFNQERGNTTRDIPMDLCAVQTMDMQPLNNLLGDYAKSRDLDPARYQLRTPMVAQPPAAPGEDPNQPPSDAGSGHQSQASSNIAPPG